MADQSLLNGFGSKPTAVKYGYPSVSRGQFAGPYRNTRSRLIPIQNSTNMSQNINFRQHYVPYQNRYYNTMESQILPQPVQSHSTGLSYSDVMKLNCTNNTFQSKPCMDKCNGDSKDVVTLQISNLDQTIDEHSIRQYLLSQLKPITPIISLTMETPSVAKVKVPSNDYAKLIVSHLHRKKVGHKRIVISYIRDPSSAETSALKCQVAGLLKDVPNYSLAVYKFRELFQSRFKSSISILDLYRMPEVCTITTDSAEEKFISLHPDLIATIQTNALIESSQHSVPYCVYHFKKEQDKGWAEQELEPLPNVLMSINQLEPIIHNLLKHHQDDIPVTSVIYCIEAELNIKIEPNDRGVPLEHLICCLRGIRISNNNFGIKVIGWMEQDSSAMSNCDVSETSSNCVSTKYTNNKVNNDPLNQISREVVELVKMSPKSTMKFNRFIPAYHNHFGKQCRVADYGYTRLIELFESLSNTIQIMGDGETRQITLTHRTQIRRFTTDLMKILRSHPTKSILLSQLPEIFTTSQKRPFDITDYGVCDISDMIDGLVNNNTIVIQPMHCGADILISMMKRKQTPSELEKTSIFAGEVVELFRNAPQYTIQFKKFVRSYHYHFGYQCRLSDYGFTKLAELLEAIYGIVTMENSTNDEDRKIFLCQKVSFRVFSEQLQELIKYCTGKATSMVKLNEILQLHKNKFGYQIQPITLGYETMSDVVKDTPYIEVLETDGEIYIISHLEDKIFRQRSYAAAILINETGSDKMILRTFLAAFSHRFYSSITEKMVLDMKHAVHISITNGIKMVSITPLMKFILSATSILEQENISNIFQLKSFMNLPYGFGFDFGYPNVSSLIQGYLDIFYSMNSLNIHERSDIRIKNDCIFTKNGLSKYIELCKQHQPNSGDRNQSKSINFDSNVQKSTAYHHQPSSQKITSTVHSSDQPRTTFFADNQRYSFNTHNHLSTHQYDRSSKDMFQTDTNNNQWFGIPNPSYIGYNTINSSSGCSSETSRIHERHSASEMNFNDILTLPDSYQAFNFSSYYEPPKPDTPPSRMIPFTFDPVWSNNTGTGIDSLQTSNNMHSLNIHLPELKTLNIMPVISSPCGHMSSSTNNNSTQNTGIAGIYSDMNNNNLK